MILKNFAQPGQTLPEDLRWRSPRLRKQWLAASLGRLYVLEDAVRKQDELARCSRDLSRFERAETAAWGRFFHSVENGQDVSGDVLQKGWDKAVLKVANTRRHFLRRREAPGDVVALAPRAQSASLLPPLHQGRLEERE